MYGFLENVKYIIENFQITKDLDDFLDIALNFDNINIVEYFVQLGVIIEDIRENLIEAAKDGRLETVKYLINYGADKFVLKRFVAVENRRMKVVEYLNSFPELN
jgi:hypothetical protein